MELSTTTVAVLLGAVGLVAVAAIVVSVLALLGQRRVRASYQVFSQGSGEDVLTLLHRHIDGVEGLRRDVSQLREHSYGLRDMIAACMSKVHTVRYDAFDDMGGHLSFSTAMLDEHGDGMVMTAINGRTDTRIYAKPVEAGSSRHNLSEEEELAIRSALSGESRATEQRLPHRPRIIRDAS